MPRSTSPGLVYEKFLGFADGTPTEIGDLQAKTFQNLFIETNSQELIRRKGTTALGTQSLSPDQEHDMIQWVRIGSSEFLVAGHDGDIIDWFAATPGTVISGGDNRFTAGIDENSAFVTNTLVIGNGVEQNVRFNGSNVRTLMVSQPGSGTIVTSFGAGPTSGTFVYRITFISADGIHGQPSRATSGTTLTGASGTILTNIPTAPAGDDSTGRGIWRTLNGGTTLYLIATINDNITTTYTDTTADADVDTNNTINLSAVRTPPLKVMTAFQNRLAGIGGNTSEGNDRTLYVSDFEIPGLCPLITPLEDVENPDFGIRILLPDVGIGVAPLGNVLLVFMRGQTWRLIGDNPNNYSFDKWLDHGCVAHRTIQSFKNLLIWLGPDGVYASEGFGQAITTNRISDDIKNRLLSLTAIQMMNANAFIWDDKYFLCFPTAAFYYDLKYRIWGEITNWLWADTTVTQNTGASKELIYAAQIVRARVWQLETGTTDGFTPIADGTPIPVFWESKDHNIGLFGREKRIHRVIVGFKAVAGTATVKLYRSTGQLIQTFIHEVDTLRKDGDIISILDKRAVPAARDEYFRLSISYSTNSPDFRIIRAGVMWTLCT